MIQAVLFDIKMYDATKARDELKHLKLKPIKRVHKTEKYLRYRIKDPESFKKLRMKNIGNGIRFIIGYL